MRVERRHNNPESSPSGPTPTAGVPAERPRDCRFGPELRLHSNRDYGRAFHRQQKAAGRYLVALVTPRKGRPARVGIMVPAKVVKTAVARHRIKRWVREWFRTSRPAALEGHDLVILLRSEPGDSVDDHRRFVGDLQALTLKALAATATPGSRGGRRK